MVRRIMAWCKGFLANFSFLCLVMGAFCAWVGYLDPDDPVIAQHPVAPVIAFTILPLTIVVVQASRQRLQQTRGWQAWDEKGRPIEVEVLDPAPIAKT
jgi:hypothetical protein